MNTVDHMLCASQASAAISQASAAISRMENISHPSSSSRLGGRAIDRHNPIIRDGRRSTVLSESTKTGSPGCAKTPKKHNNNNGNGHNHKKFNSPKGKKPRGRDGGILPAGDPISSPPAGSTRYLLSDPVFFDGLSDSDPVPIPIESADDLDKPEEVIDFDEDRLIISASKVQSSSSLFEQRVPVFYDGLPDYDPVLSLDNPNEDPINISQEPPNHTEDKPAIASEQKSTSSFPENEPSSDQVVVLRVSLHCKGCAGKVKKHLSRMQGVTSFNVDFAAKKVTVTGDVTPLGVLASISKVKNAQFWTDIKK